jgi:tRNA dimethylallyltransferase
MLGLYHARRYTGIMLRKPKILVIIGPTSSGKSQLAVRLTRQLNGEIISADSRQIYRGMDIGTGKVKGRWLTVKRGGKKARVYFYKNIPHYLIDIASPRTQFSVARFQKLAKKSVADILARGKLPIICGGTAHWVDALVYGQKFPEVKPNSHLRAQLEKKSVAQLFAQLKKLDPARAATIERHNPRRLIRALEIVLTTKQVVPPLAAESPFQIKWLGINPPQAILYKHIETRLDQRLKAGMFHEVKRLHKHGLSWKRLESFGLEYKYGALFLQKKLSYDEAREQLLTAIKNYSKRQMTWWKRNKDIRWQR